MQFNRIRLSGFKSFVDPTELYIEPGLTGIVGPNGCGKSNLLEALKWVMGENSPKRMRGEMMDDVIFSGTERRPARNLAEVTLLIDNSDRSAPARFNDSDDIEVSRRIERESGSAYRINGEEVRAKDVQRLFADAATGANSPALVSQGKVSSFVNAKPQERRQILEEAAGISGLHSRRKEAEQRLKAAENNLVRLDDIMGQMDAQAKSLKYQARQATRYKNIAGHIRRTHAILMYLKWRELRDLVAGAEEKLREIERKVGAETSDVAKLNSESEKLHEGLPALRQKEAEASAAFNRVRIEYETLEAEEKNIQARIEELKARLAQLGQDLERESQFLGDSEATLKQQREEESALRQALESESQDAAGIEQAYREAFEAAETEEAKFNDLNSAVTSRQIRVQHLENDLQALASRRDRLKAEEEAARTELSEMEGVAAATPKADRSKVDAALKALRDAEAKLGQCETARLEAQGEFEKAREAFAEAKAGLAALEGEIAALKTLSADDEGGDRPKIASAVKVEPGFEAALSAAIGDDLEATEGHDGPLHWEVLGALENAPALPAGAKPLSDFVTGSKALERRLGQVGVVENGEKLMAALNPGQRLVSKDGTLWRWDGLVRTSKAPTRAAQKILQKNKLAALEKKCSGGQAELAKLGDVLTKREARLSEHRGAETDARQAYQAANATYQAERDKISEGEEEAIKAAERAAALREALKRLETDSTEARDKMVAIETEIKTLAEDTAKEQELERQRATLASVRDTLAETRSKFESWRQIRDEKQARLDRLTREAEAWNERAKAAASQIEELKQRIAQTEQQLADLDQNPARLEEKRKGLMDQMSASETRCGAVRDDLQTLENAIQAKDREFKEAQARLAEIREDMVRRQSQHENATERKAEVEHMIGEEFHAGAEELLEKTEVTEAQLSALASVHDAEAKLENLKAERERLGAVNLRADVELEELSAEIERLTKERDELQTAINKLRYNIGQLNREGRQKMLEAFEAVNVTFGELFAQIFNGGSAHLVLTESEDPLEAGLDIMAAPPGKKLLHRSLLSGGEQALTAITLIFAVFLTNPAPVCVLDEVDAPLDDANVERFCDLLNEVKGRTSTRFIVVTHNAISMSRMERLYGVTMAEGGVSQLVSVELDQAEEMRALA